MIYARRSPSGHRWRSATSPVRGGLRRGQSRPEELCPVTAARTLASLCPFFIKKGQKKFQRLTPKAKHLFTAFYRSKQVLIFYGFVYG